MINKTCEGLIHDLAKYALKGIPGTAGALGECETELFDRIKETIQDFISSLQEDE